MKITIDHYKGFPEESTWSVEIPDEADMEKLFDTFRFLSLALGYPCELVERYFDDE